MSGNLFSYIGWTFLPNLVTGWIQYIYYGVTIRAGDPKPQPGSPRFNKHRQRIYIAVIVAYLLYTIYEADHDVRLAGDFYQDLGLPHDVDDKGIKSRFRRLAALHHPDKLSPSESSTASESYFVHLKLAQDTLLSPTKRFAYDRFGIIMLSWQHCSSVRDYLFAGLQTTAPMYAGSAIFMVILGVAGYLQWGRFWRYLTFSALILLEFHTVTRPYQAPLLKFINPLLTTFTTHPPLLPFQLLILARKSALTVFIALSQLGTLFQGTPPPQTKSDSSHSDLEQLNRLEMLAKTNETETTRLLQLDLAPFAGDETGVNQLRGRIREFLVQNTIRADPEVRDAIGRAMGKRRIGAPAGARLA